MTNTNLTCGSVTGGRSRQRLLIEINNKILALGKENIPAPLLTAIESGDLGKDITGKYVPFAKSI